MRHEYYYYNKEELLKNPKIPLIVMEDNLPYFAPWQRKWWKKSNG